MNIEEINRLDNKQFTDREVKLLDDIFRERIIYESALHEIKLRLETLKVSFRMNELYNPIEHIKVRLKEPKSLLRKVYIRDIPLDIDSVKENILDIAGVRIVCTFKNDIYKLAEYICKYEDITVLNIKDYVENPKPSGYQSYHMLIELPIYMSEGKKTCKVEIQIRTLAMDFWAALEHKIKYKYDLSIPTDIKEELYECSKIASSLDENMLHLHKKVHGVD